MSELIILKLKDGEVLAVNRELLTSNSPEFNRLINIEHQTELEMDDFDNDAVAVFLSSLEYKLLELENPFNPTLFRNLHKMAEVFQVRWMRARCREHLADTIEATFDQNTDHVDVVLQDTVVSLLEECRFIKQRWKDGGFVRMLVLKLQSIDCSCFIKVYMQHFTQLTKDQIRLTLQAAGKRTEAVLEILKQSLEGARDLHQNTAFLLRNINLALCWQQNRGCCQDIFELLGNLPDISHDETKLIFKLYRQAVPKAVPELMKTDTHHKTYYLTSAVLELLPYGDVFIDYVIDKVLGADPREMGMWVLMDFLHTCALNKPDIFQDQNPAALVKKMEASCLRYKWKQISCQFVTAMLKNEASIIGLTYKSLLDHILNSDILTSYTSSMEVVCNVSYREGSHYALESLEEEGNSAPLSYSEFCFKEFRYPFLFQHPGVEECVQHGKCGFLLRTSGGMVTDHTIDLCSEVEAPYPLDLHFHDVVKMEDMFVYLILVRTYKEDRSVTLPGASPTVMGSPMTWSLPQGRPRTGTVPGGSPQGSPCSPRRDPPRKVRFPTAVKLGGRRFHNPAYQDLLEQINVCYDISKYLLYKPE